MTAETPLQDSSSEWSYPRPMQSTSQVKTSLGTTSLLVMRLNQVVQLTPSAESSEFTESTNSLKIFTRPNMESSSSSEISNTLSLESQSLFWFHPTMDLEMRLTPLDMYTSYYQTSPREISSSMLTMTRRSWDSLASLTLRFLKISTGSSWSHSIWVTTPFQSSSLLRRTPA